MAAVRERSGIVGDVKGLATTGLRAIRTRFELLAIEIKEEKAWAVRFLVIAVAALYLLSFGLLLAIFALVVWAAEADRPAILAAFAGLFLASGAAGVVYIMHASKSRTPLFQDTIAVLKGDEQALREGMRGSGD
ncbi:MAG: phage holin family protein [Usitatibacter sp.]